MFDMEKKIDFNANYIHGLLSIAADIHFYTFTVPMSLVATTCVISFKVVEDMPPVISIMFCKILERSF